MRTSVFGLTLGLCGMAIMASVVSIAGKDETITGTVVDLSCYAMNQADRGMHHLAQGGAKPPNVGFECAYSCVRWQGMPAGLLTDDGKVYQIEGGLRANSNAKIAPHLTHRVTITGNVTEVDRVLLIEADDVKMVQ
jgi:hypothetical protein